MEKEPELVRFFRNAHLVRVLVDEIMEQGFLAQTCADVSFEELNLLKFIARPTETYIGHLRRFRGVSFAAISKSISKLDSAGLVKKNFRGKDHRAGLLSLTKKGKEVVRKYESLKVRRMKACLRDVSPREISSISTSLEKVIDLLMSERPFVGDPCLGCGAYYSDTCQARMRLQECPCHVESSEGGTA